ncbi:GL23997 [Drosophila persimilis]|nr:GL23997 [Drosophila persimilis]
MMIPDSKRRLQKEYEVLQKFLDDEVDLKETETYTKAAEILTEAKGVLAV